MDALKKFIEENYAGDEYSACKDCLIEMFHLMYEVSKRKESKKNKILKLTSGEMKTLLKEAEETFMFEIEEQ